MAATIDKPPEVRPSPAATSTAGLRPLRSRYVIAVLLPLVALGAAIGWYGSSWSAGEHQYLDMAQSSLPVVLKAGPGSSISGGPWYVYSEGNSAVTSVRVTDTLTGAAVPVTMKSVSVENFGGLSPRQVASFKTNPSLRPQPRPLRIEIAGSGYARVGGYDATQAMRWTYWGIAVLLVVNVGASIAIIVVPIVRRRRHQPA
jgi:hypothetical protein